jgi:YD repeat-containing protein
MRQWGRCSVISGHEGITSVTKRRSNWVRGRTLASLAVTAVLLALAPSMHVLVASAGGTQGQPTDAIPQAASYGGFNPVAPNLAVCSEADPVECSDGNFYQDYSLISIPGRGVPLDLTLSYNSGLVGHLSPVGYGWVDSYGMTLTVSGTQVTVTLANGSAITFTQSGSTYAAPTWAQATLSASGGGYTFVDQNDQTTYTFNSSGQVTSETDADGYVTQLSYSGSELSTVTDAAGRTLTFTYNGSGQLTKVTDPASRTVSFAYSTGGNLASVTDTGGGTPPSPTAP